MKKKWKNSNTIILLAHQIKNQDKRAAYRVEYKERILTKKEIEEHDWEVVSEDLEITPIGEYQTETIFVYKVSPIYPRRKELENE